MRSIVINTNSIKKDSTLTIGFLFKIFIAALLLLWCTGIFYPFLISEYFNVLVYTFLNHTYSLVCHQSEQKLIMIDGHHSLLCARCTGIYLGALLISISYLFISFKLKFNHYSIIFALLIMLMDVIFVNAGIYNYNILLALATGIIFGSVIFNIISESLNIFFFQILDSRSFDE